MPKKPTAPTTDPNLNSPDNTMNTDTTDTPTTTTDTADTTAAPPEAPNAPEDNTNTPSEADTDTDTDADTNQEDNAEDDDSDNHDDDGTDDGTDTDSPATTNAAVWNPKAQTVVRLSMGRVAGPTLPRPLDWSGEAAGAPPSLESWRPLIRALDLARARHPDKGVTLVIEGIQMVRGSAQDQDAMSAAVSAETPAGWAEILMGARTWNALHSRTIQERLAILTEWNALPEPPAGGGDSELVKARATWEKATARLEKWQKEGRDADDLDVAKVAVDSATKALSSSISAAESGLLRKVTTVKMGFRLDDFSHFSGAIRLGDAAAPGQLQKHAIKAGCTLQTQTNGASTPNRQLGVPVGRA